jgi:hypothetical protein
MVRAAQHDEAVAIQHAHQAFQAQAQQWDREFESKHAAELKNKQAAAEISKEIVAALKEGGASDEDIAQGYGYGSGRLGNLRHPLAQEALWSPGKTRWAANQMRSGRRDPIPQVQRPGVAGEPRGRIESELVNLDKALNNKQSARAAAQLVAARRRSR